MTQISPTYNNLILNLFLQSLQQQGKQTRSEQFLIALSLLSTDNPHSHTNLQTLTNLLIKHTILPFHLIRLKKNSKYRLIYTSYYKSISTIINSLIKTLKNKKHLFQKNLHTNLLNCTSKTNFLHLKKQTTLKTFLSLSDKDIQHPHNPKVTLNTTLTKKKYIKTKPHYKKKPSKIPKKSLIFPNTIQHNNHKFLLENTKKLILIN